MLEFITLFAVGIILILLGMSNRKGNINSIHSYHRNRVSEEDKPIFGKLMGNGSIICGVGILVCGVLDLLTEFTGMPIFTTISPYIIFTSLAVGIGFMIYATNKYNKGIF